MRSPLPHAGQRVEQPGNRRRNLRHVERRAEQGINRKKNLLRAVLHVEQETNRFCITWNRIPAEEPSGRGEDHPGNRILS